MQGHEFDGSKLGKFSIVNVPFSFGVGKSKMLSMFDLGYRIVMNFWHKIPA